MGGGTIVAMKKQPDEELQCAVHCRQLRRSEQLGPLPSLYIQDTSQKGESRDHTGLENMVVQYLEQKTPEKHVSSRETQLEKPASGAAAVMGNSNGKGTRDS